MPPEDSAAPPQAMPDGIALENIVHRRQRANPLPLALLAALLGAGLAGLLGGASDNVRVAHDEAASISVRAPEILRSGMVFETLVEVRPTRSVDDLAVGVSDTLWRQMTINTVLPTAEKEDYRDGWHRFSFGPARAGEIVRFKIDGQINPPLFAGTSGEIVAFDGERKLAGLTLRMRVLP